VNPLILAVCLERLERTKYLGTPAAAPELVAVVESLFVPFPVGLSVQDLLFTELLVERAKARIVRLQVSPSVFGCRLPDGEARGV
jgi:hypothetical protein